MADFYNFAGEHPLLVFVLALILSHILCWPFRLVSRWIRHRNIAAAGWPPEYLDADGDQIEHEQEEGMA